MLKVRVMPCLLLSGGGLVKTVRFRDPSYVGDPVNTIMIFNEQEVDELILLDIGASPLGAPPNWALLEEVADECFMPFAYGGGVRDVEDARRLFGIGAEKVVVNTRAHEDPAFVTRLAERFGSQSVIAGIDVRRTLLGRYEVCTRGGRERTGKDPVRWAAEMARAGAGEILLTAMDRDGTFSGYDLELTRRVSDAVEVLVIACGGAGGVEDFGRAVREGGAAAVAAGSLVVYQGRHRAVLINFPRREALRRVLAGGGESA